MKILVAEKLAAPGVALLEREGHVIVNKFVAGDALKDAMAEVQPEVLVVRSTKVTAPIIDADPNLELIIRAGAGFDTIDIDHASKKGVYVCNCPGKNSAAVAELTIGLICALDRKIADNVADSRKGMWNKAKYSKAAGLTDKTLGIIGQGNIAQEVISRAKGMQMKVIAWSRSLTPEGAQALGVQYAASPLDVAAKADIVSLHVAANAGTKKLANREFFEAMKKDAIFINTTRGSVVDEEALRWALDNKGIQAGLDVFENEPAGKEGPCEIPLAAHPNVYITHHIGASTDQAQDVTAIEAARIINKFAAEQVADNCVNSETPDSKKRGCVTVRYMDKVGVLAAILTQIKDAGWNVREISNVLFKGGEAAAVRIRYEVAESKPESPLAADQIQKAIAALPNVISANVSFVWNMEVEQ